MNSSSMSAMGSSGAGPTAASTAVVIHISKFAYQTPASVSPGAKVTVMNMDGEAHTVTADTGSAFDSKIDPGASSTFTAPMKPGTYAFHCTYHGNMHGMLVVK
jgi:plastocyanin